MVVKKRTITAPATINTWPRGDKRGARNINHTTVARSHCCVVLV